MRRVLAAFAAATLFSAPADAIVTRHDVDADAYRVDVSDHQALASLFETPEGNRDCVATLIAPQWLVTARHCTEDPALDGLVEKGEFTVKFADGREIPIAAIERMPVEEGPSQRTDVALLKLARGVTDIAPIPLYDGASGSELGRVAFFPGWGRTGDGEAGLGEEDGLFRIAENRIDSTFDRFLVFRFDDPRSHIERALPLEGVSGPGDSGGPALLPTPHGLRVVGISSAQRTYGMDEGRYNVEEYYVRISAVRDWIDRVIAAD